MSTVTLKSLRNEVEGMVRPQLSAADAFLAHSDDVTLELSELTDGQLSAVAALMLALDEAVARARRAEHALAMHRSACVCHALEMACCDVEAEEDDALWLEAGAANDLVLLDEAA